MTVTTEKTTLPKFGEHDVVAAKVKISGSGTGLSDALDFDPVALDIGDTAYLTVRVTVAGVDHRPNKDDEIVRIHNFKVAEMAFMDDDMSEKILAVQRDEVQRRKDEIEGQTRLDALEAERAAEERERHDSNVTSPA